MTNSESLLVNNSAEILGRIILPDDITALLREAKSCMFVGTSEEIYRLSCPEVNENGVFEVGFDVPGKGYVVEATVVRARNGISANFTEPYMRKRDPDCMTMADDLPTDKPRFSDRFGHDFSEVRDRTFEWLKTQDLLAYFFHAGGEIVGLDVLAIMPVNTAFFGFSLALLQGIIDLNEIPDQFQPKGFAYVAPPFRHTDFDGKQIVVHSRKPDYYEMFSFNLYPGPSAKKGVYSMLIHQGEQETPGWVTMHCSAVQVTTPYDATIGMSHEGASGGGKSELLEYAHRQMDNSLLLGHNLVTNEDKFLNIPVMCRLRPLVDDMALCHPKLQTKPGRLTLFDAERAWFVRVDHILQYGTDPHLEATTINAPIPLAFLNLSTVNNSTALIWEHTMDSLDPPKRCSNPRVVLPRQIAENVYNEPLQIDVRSFGIRAPPCTAENPTYGIFGLFHIIPPALAWIWRLIAPRGDANPSIVETEGMQSEGVGSYWPSCPGRRVTQANLLLEQILNTNHILYILCPNQHIGAWKTRFMPEWLAREYLARRGSIKFPRSMVEPARCELLGYAMKAVTIEGQSIPIGFLQVDKQPEVGEAGYDQGADILREFTKKNL